MDEPDSHYYAKDYATGAWCVRGDDGLYLSVSNMDKNIAYIIGKLLSGKLEDAKSLLDSCVRL